ncbi:hypothetical protein BJ742DRAFT_887384 [Cladochytrium replicatum]|nr:hypothetical protein BJ742DRAFT_887384 [Cladochytrium replicatum]
MGTVGMKNLGNTCFMNSTIQCLSGTVPLARYFMDGSYRKHVNKANPLGTKGQIVDGFAELVRSLYSDERVVVPVRFKDIVGTWAVQFRGNDQQDSQEFLAFLLDKLHEDLNVGRRNKLLPAPKPTKEPEEEPQLPDDVGSLKAWNSYIQTNWSIVVDMFQGQYKSTLQCTTCQKVSTTFDHFMYLTLPIPNVRGTVTLAQCIAKFCEEEILDGDDAWHCPRCKKPRRALKKLEIVRLPAILLVHLKRFYYQGPFRNKIETMVQFPVMELNMAPYLPSYGRRPYVMDQPSPTVEEPYFYDLYGVSNHMGGLNGGHYTAHVRNMYRNQWFNFDDSYVTGSSPESVQSRSAYILYYVRQVPPGVKSVMGNWWSAGPRM